MGQKPQRMRVAIFWVIVGLIIGGLWSGCRNRSAAEDARPPQRSSRRGAPSRERARAMPNARAPLVQVAFVEQRALDVRISSTATLFSEADVIVFPETTGRIVRILVDVGKWVEKGDLLIQLEDETQRVQYEKARVQKERLEQELKRQEQLYEAQLIAREAYETTLNQYRQAVLDFETARINLERTQIRAPIRGQVVERFVTEGQLVTPTTQLVRIVNTRELYGRIFLPERELPRVHVDLPVLIESDLFPNRTFRGVVDQVSPVVDAQSGTFRVRFRVRTGIGALRPGMFVRVHLIVETKEKAVVVPKVALVRERDRDYVFVVQDGRVRRRPVRLGLDSGDVVEILEGVQPGERVVIAGHTGLQDGQRVRIFTPRGPRSQGE